MATRSSRLAMLACVIALMPCFSSGLIPLELRGEAGGTRLRLRGGGVNLMESEEGMRMLHTVHGCLEATLSADQRIREEGEAALRQVRHPFLLLPFPSSLPLPQSSLAAVVENQARYGRGGKRGRERESGKRQERPRDNLVDMGRGPPHTFTTIIAQS
jgi:hypothetical protein